MASIEKPEVHEGVDAVIEEAKAVDVGRMGAGFLAIIRTDSPVGQWLDDFCGTIKIANPEWTGATLVLKTDQDTGFIPEDQAWNVYLKLKKAFDGREDSFVSTESGADSAQA
jgi:hypothetical protein